MEEKWLTLLELAANVRLVNENEAIKLRGTVGATITPGQPVYLDGTSGWKPADADAAASGLLRGLALSDGYGSVSFAIGTVIDIVVFGRMAGFSGMTPGANVYVSLDAGELTHTAPPDPGDSIVAADGLLQATSYSSTHKLPFLPRTHHRRLK
ncbi:MAG: hypothetical protein LC108_00635 [Anaerolineales bacterium]|nr:hypothetical protein [Anaerolineales bacterium]